MAILKNRSSYFISTAALVIVLALTACAGESITSDRTEKGKDEMVSTAPSEQGSTVETARPAVKEFEVLTSEGTRSLEATLHQSEEFSLYVFEGLTFDKTTNRLSLRSNPEYYVDIEPLSSDYNLAQLEAAGKEQLSQYGEVFNYSGELVEHPLGFAHLYLQSSGNEGVNDYIVWTSEAGNSFLFTLHNPKEEEATHFAGLVWTSLSTVEKNK